MPQKPNPQLATLNIKDQQLLELCGQEVLHAARKGQVKLKNKDLQNQLKLK